MINFLDKITDFFDDVLLPESIQEMVELGDSFFSNKQYEQAISTYKNVVNAKPEYIWGHFKLALAYYHGRNYDSAIYILRNIIQLRPQFKESINLLGLAYVAQKKYGLAKSQFLQAIKLAPNIPDFYYNLGMCYSHQDQYDLAIKEFRKAIRINPDYGDYYTVLGQTYFNQKKLDDAEKAFKKAILYDEKNASIYLNLGIIYIDAKQFDNAELYLEQSLKLNPHDPSVKYYLAKAKLYHQDYQEAIQLLETIKDLMPKSYDDLGSIYLEMGNIHKAIHNFEKCIELIPNDLSAYYHFAKANKIIQRYDVAKHALEKVLTMDANFIDGLIEMGEISILENNLAAATQYFSQAKRVDVNSVPAIMGLGNVMLSRGKFDEAIGYFKEVLRKHPNNQQVNQLLEKTYQQRDTQQYKKFEGSDKLFSILTKTLDKLKQHPQLSDFALQIASLRESLDLPLLITIMGEFNTGKSTFINSLIGEKIAPMGIRPTTATINYLKYGTMKKLRIIWQNGEVQEAEIGRLAEFADERKADSELTRKIKLVEILYPLEILKEVNIVDTPGLNVSLKEHEETTKGFVEGADAVIWLFAVDQAGKETEKEALEFLQQFSKKTVGVVNKVDLANPDEVTEITNYLQKDLSGYIAGVLPLSAKKSLQAKTNRNPQLLVESGFSQLENMLDEKIFKHSKMLKLHSIQNQLTMIFGRISAIYTQYEQEFIAYFHHLDKIKTKIEQKKKYFENEIIPRTSKNFRNQVTDLYHQTSLQITQNTIKKGFFNFAEMSDEDKDYLRKFVRDGFIDVVTDGKDLIENNAQNFSEEVIVLWKKEFLNPRFKSLGTFPAIFALNNQSKLSSLNEMVFDSIAIYYRGYADAGAVDDALEPAEDAADAFTRLERFHPILVETLMQEKIYKWLDDYFNFLSNFCKMTEDNLNEIYLDTVQTVFKPLERYQEELQTFKKE